MTKQEIKVHIIMTNLTTYILDNNCIILYMMNYLCIILILYSTIGKDYNFNVYY